MKPTDKIAYKGVVYPVWEINPTEKYVIRIASEELDDALTADVDSTDKAERVESEVIDNKIYCFMPRAVLELSESEVVKYFVENFN